MLAKTLIFVAFAAAGLADKVQRRQQDDGRDHILNYPCTGNTRYAKKQDEPGNMSGKITLQHLKKDSSLT